MSILSFLNPAGIMADVYKWLAIAGIGLAIGVGSYFYGVHVGDDNSKIAIASYAANVTKLTTELDDAIQPQAISVVTKYVTQVIHDQQSGVNNNATAKTIVKEVPTSNVAADNVSKFVSNGFVSVYNSAIAGTTATSASAADGAASSFTAIDVLANDTRNYATCNEVREELIGLQTWVNDYNADIAKINSANKKK
jgi:hypothetical protein